MNSKSLVLLAAALASFVLNGCQPAQHDEVAPVSVALPLEVQDPYAVASSTPIPERKPEDWNDLHNVFHLSDDIISGSEPHGEEALKRIAAMGVKTIVSVDGKVPDHEAAAKLGMRYVHIPIQYKGITDDELLRLSKTFRELEGPFFVHCFHGKHRGPAAAAVGRLVRDGAPREQALAEMRQWCGTAGKYSGLYETIAKAAIPTADETRRFSYDFPPAQELPGFRHAMIDLSRIFDDVKLLAKNGWKPDPTHPDLDPGNETRKLAELLTRSESLPDVQSEPADFKEWLGTSAEHARLLRQAFHQYSEGEVSARPEVDDHLKQVEKSCNACHLKYRDH